MFGETSSKGYDGQDVKAIWYRIGAKMDEAPLFDSEYKKIIFISSCAVKENQNQEEHLVACKVLENISKWCIKLAAPEDATAVGLALMDEKVLKNIADFLSGGEAPTRWPVVSLCTVIENIVNIPWSNNMQKLEVLRSFFSLETRLYEALLECSKRDNGGLTVCTVKVIENVILKLHDLVADNICGTDAVSGSTGTPATPLRSLDGTHIRETERAHLESRFSKCLPDLLHVVLFYHEVPLAQEAVMRTVADIIEGTELRWMDESRLEPLRREIVGRVMEMCSEFCANCDKELNLAATAMTAIKFCSRLMDHSFRNWIANNADLINTCVGILRGDVGNPAKGLIMYNLLRRGACATIHNVCLDPDVAERLCYLETCGKTAPFPPHMLSEEVAAELASNPLLKETRLMKSLVVALLVEKDPRVFRDIWMTISLFAKYPQNINALLQDALLHEVVIECICVHLTEASGYSPNSNMIIKNWTHQGPEVCALIALARVCGACCNPLYIGTSEEATSQISKVFKCLRSGTMLKVLQLLAGLNSVLDLNGHARTQVEEIQSLGMLCLCALYGRRGDEVVIHVADLMQAHKGASHQFQPSIITTLKRTVESAHAAFAVKAGQTLSEAETEASTKGGGDAFFSCQVNWLVNALSNLCVNWIFSRALSVCEELVGTLGIMLGRFRQAVNTAADGTRQTSMGVVDEYWRDGSLLECLLLSLVHMYLSLPADTADPLAPIPNPKGPTYDVVVEKGGPGVALGMMVVQDRAGVIRLKSIQKNVILKSLSAEAEGCMRAGDVLVGIGGQDISDWDLAAAVVELNDRKVPQGSTVRLTYRRPQLQPQARHTRCWHKVIKTNLEGLLLAHFNNKTSGQCRVSSTAVEYALLLLALMSQAGEPRAHLCRNPPFDPEIKAQKGSAGGTPPSATATNSVRVWYSDEHGSEASASKKSKTVLVNHGPELVAGGSSGGLFAKFLQSLREQAAIEGASVVTTTELLASHELAARLVTGAGAVCTADGLAQGCRRYLSTLVDSVRGCNTVAQCLTESLKYNPHCRVICNVTYHTRRYSEAKQPEPNTAGATQSRTYNLLLTKGFSPRSACKESLKLFQTDDYSQRILLGNVDMVALPRDRARELPYSWLPLWKRGSEISSEVDVIKCVSTILHQEVPKLTESTETPLRNHYPLLAYMLSNPATAEARRRAEEQAIVEKYAVVAAAAKERWIEEVATREREARVAAAKRALEDAEREAAAAVKKKEEDAFRRAVEVRTATESTNKAAIAARQRKEELHKHQAANAFTLSNIFNWWEDA